MEEINIETLLKVANMQWMLQLTVITRQYYFNVQLNLVQTLYDTVGKLYKDEILKKFKEFEDQKFVRDFKNEVMRAILDKDLLEDDFNRLKENLESNKLLKDLEEGTVSMNFFRVVNELDRVLKPGRKYNELKLVAQKNMVLIQLGYRSIHEGLLAAAE